MSSDAIATAADAQESGLDAMQTGGFGIRFAGRLIPARLFCRD